MTIKALHLAAPLPEHPGIRACLTDHVIFLDGGGSTLPMPNLNTLTVEQADALVAQLRNG